MEAFRLEQAALSTVENPLSISTFAKKRTKPVLGSILPGLIDVISLSPIGSKEGTF